jgi:hypothetical protein
MENNLSISEILQEDGHLERTPSWGEVASLHDALVRVTGEDNFLQAPDFTLAYGDDYENPVTDEMWIQVGAEANLVAPYAREVAVEWCHIEAPSWQDLGD